MQDFPHRYAVKAAGTVTGDLQLTAAGLPPIRAASPAQFDGPGDRWSPENLLVAAVAGCFVLTFRAVARASRLPWTELHCEANGTLDRVDRTMQFTRVELRASLTVPDGTKLHQVQRAFEKAEHNCLISNSLKAPIELKTNIVVEEPAFALSA